MSKQPLTAPGNMACKLGFAVEVTTLKVFRTIAEKSRTLCFPASVCPTVGVGGHFSGGGYGTLLRKYGLAADNIIDAHIVDVQGSEGGNSKITIQALFNSLFLGGVDRLIPLMENSFPELGLTREDCLEMSWIESILYFAGFPSEEESLGALLNRTVSGVPLSYKAKSDYVKQPIPEAALEGIWDKMYEEQVGGAILIFRPYGGRMDEISESETPFPHRAGNIYKIQHLIHWEKERSKVESQRHINWMRELYAYFTPYVSNNPREGYVNYRDLDIGINSNNITSYTQSSIWGIKYFKNNFNRLVHVKTRVDPTNFFRNEQSIPPLSSRVKKTVEEMAGSGLIQCVRHPLHTALFSSKRHCLRTPCTTATFFFFLFPSRASSGRVYSHSTAHPSPQANFEQRQVGTVDVPQVNVLKQKMEVLGITCTDSCVPGRYYNVLCPMCKGGQSMERSLSLHIVQNGDFAMWRCFRIDCGWAGRAFTDDRVVHDRVDKEAKSTRPKTEESLGLVPLNDKIFGFQLITYFRERMISEETLRRNGVMQLSGDKCIIAFTYKRNGLIVGCKYRTIEKRFWQEKDTEKVLYGLDDINDAAEVEGEIDKLSMEEAGLHNCVSVPGGAPKNVSKLSSLAKGTAYQYLQNCKQYFDKVCRIILATDGDMPGQALAEELARRLGKDRCWQVRWPKKDDCSCFKDANEVLNYMGPDALREVVESAEIYRSRIVD
ncbi:hypothetical protein FNV43_RR06294 [Rhamnella rubrinervis]|uniref:Toprim domain-containing protein n=1 Tax=Rhamnella rubrinervis TaxID=2594499 RepID=A0A8K0ML97_9ROSA|nr:hypothetical protein FNV43_RR06294 [Rhamnella rubrinervis]